MPDSLDAAYRTYHQNNAQIKQMKENNETFLSKCNGKYGPYFTQGHRDLSMLPVITDQQTRPLFNGPDNYVPQENNAYTSPGMSRPPPYQPPRQQEHSISYQHSSYQAQVRGTSNNTVQHGPRQPSEHNKRSPSRKHTRETTNATPSAHPDTPVPNGRANQAALEPEDNTAPKKKASSSSSCRIRTT